MNSETNNFGSAGFPDFSDSPDLIPTGKNAQPVEPGGRLIPLEKRRLIKTSYKIKGRVFSLENGQPIPFAHITVTDLQKDKVKMAADAEGRFVFEAKEIEIQEEKCFRITVKHNGYLPMTVDEVNRYCHLAIGLEPDPANPFPENGPDITDAWRLDSGDLPSEKPGGRKKGW